MMIEDGMTRKLGLVPILLATGCLTAGVYGMLHDQVSYTVSPEYFTVFKFHQFSIPDACHNRIGAALVGFQATWWMGLLLAPPSLFVGLLMANPSLYLRHVSIAFVVVAFTALVIGLGALAYSFTTDPSTLIPFEWIPSTVQDKASFARVGFMHNWSYAGGFLGMGTGPIYLLIAWARRAWATAGLQQ